MKVGFIGLGIMGKPMCRNLMKAGYEAVVYNRSKASVEELTAEGAQAAGSPAEVAENCQVIITMLPNSPQVREVCLGENGIASAAKEGTEKNKKKRKKKRRFGLVSRIILSIVTLVVVIFAIYSAVSLALIKKIHYVESNITSYSGLLDESYVKNVLLIGTDGRTASDRGRSDTMILLSINSKTDEIFLTSLMRDSYVDISGYGWNKLNAAYSFGGPELLIDTIQRNFDVKVTDYIAVNFNAFAAVVDAVDGVEINVSDSEAEAINQILHDEVNELMGDAIDSDYLSSGGKYKLNGKQALSYARIRYVGNADFERTERQREVLSKIADNMKTFNPKKLTGVMKAALPEMTTNMKTRELYLLSLRLPFLLRYDIEQLRVPADDTWTGNNVYIGDDLSSVLEVDFNANIDMLKQKVFTDKK